MKPALDGTALSRWRSDPVCFVEEVLCDPESGKAFVLLEAEREFMARAFMLDGNGRLVYPELVYGAPKKSGKTTLAAIIVLVMVLLRRDGRFAEGYCVANDLDQAVSRVFTVIRRSSRRRHCCVARPRSLPIGSAFLRSTPPLSHWRAMRRVLLAATRR